MSIDQMELPLTTWGEAPASEGGGEAGPTPSGPAHPGNDDRMAVIVERNMIGR
jgi:hypothetical protein